MSYIAYSERFSAAACQFLVIINVAKLELALVNSTIQSIFFSAIHFIFYLKQKKWMEKAHF